MKVVALGGGHGLANTLRALRSIEVEPTAIVGVADDGGSSGRIRDELGFLPPGDLRMALAALCPDPTWSGLLQYRFTAPESLAGHSVGNLLITALWQRSGDPVAGLDEIGTLIGVRGRVLPVSAEPLTIHAEVREADGTLVALTGQHRVAVASGQVERIWIEPTSPASLPQTQEAIAGADVVILGPGSWYTSVLTHVLIPEVRAALAETPARRVLVTNVRPRIDRETKGLSIGEHMRIVHRYAPEVRFDVVVTDSLTGADSADAAAAAAAWGATIVQGSLEDPAIPGIHHPERLGAALATVFPVV